MHVAGVSGASTYPDVSSALARMGYSGMATSHACRTWFSTCANETGWNSDVIKSNSRMKNATKYVARTTGHIG